MDSSNALSEIERADLIRRLVEEECAYLFKHALVQDAAYSTLMKQERKHLHRRVAEALEHTHSGRLDEIAASLAQHYSAAGDDAKIVEYAIRAGNVAQRVEAQPEARFHYANALNALGRLPDSDHNRRRRMDTLINQVWMSLFSDAPAVNLARLAEAESLMQQWLASDSTVLPQLGQIYHLKGFTHQLQNDWDTALRYYDDERTLAQRLGDAHLLALSTFAMALLQNLQGRFAESEPLVRESIELMRQAGMPLQVCSPFSVLGLVLAAQGQYAQGLAEAQYGLALAQETNNASATEIGYALLAEIYLMGRDIPRMLEADAACLHGAQASHDIVWECYGYFFLALGQSFLGQRAKAMENVQRARKIREMLRGKPPRYEWLTAVESFIFLNMNQLAEAQALAGRAVSEARSVDSVIAEGIAQRVWAQALVSQNAMWNNHAEAHLAESMRSFESGNARLEVAHTHLAWGTLLQGRGDTSAARQHFEQAAGQFELSGLTRQLEHAHALLAG